jgi:hypothetical protein
MPSRHIASGKENPKQINNRKPLNELTRELALARIRSISGTPPLEKTTNKAAIDPQPGVRWRVTVRSVVDGGGGSAVCFFKWFWPALRAPMGGPGRGQESGGPAAPVDRICLLQRPKSCAN